MGFGGKEWDGEVERRNGSHGRHGKWEAPSILDTPSPEPLIQ